MKIAYRAQNVLPSSSTSSMKDAVVIVEGGRIESVGYSVPKKAKYVNLGEVTLMPGLIDAHVHFMWSGEGADPEGMRRSETREMCIVRMVRNAQQTIAAGITTCRDTGGPTEMVIAMRKALELGLIVG